MNTFISFFTNPPETGVAAYIGHELKPTDGLLAAIAYVFALLTALILHEYSHGYVAYKCGDTTAKYNGRLSLNPKNHLDPLGTICMFLFGFGWAKPVPINPANFTNYRRSIFLVSIAGVVANLIIAFVCCGLYYLTLFITISAASVVQSSVLLYSILYILSVFFLYGEFLNIGLFLFNLIPLYPLDGSHILDLILPQTSKVSVFLRKNGHKILYGLIFLGLAADLLGIEWIDILGVYLNYAGTVISWLINSFWELIF